MRLALCKPNREAANSNWLQPLRAHNLSRLREAPLTSAGRSIRLPGRALTWPAARLAARVLTWKHTVRLVVTVAARAARPTCPVAPASRWPIVRALAVVRFGPAQIGANFWPRAGPQCECVCFARANLGEAEHLCSACLTWKPQVSISRARSGPVREWAKLNLLRRERKTSQRIRTAEEREKRPTHDLSGQHESEFGLVVVVFSISLLHHSAGPSACSPASQQADFRAPRT